MSDRGPSPADLLRAALDAQHVTDPTTRAAIAAIAGGESGFAPRSETSYAHTGNPRIREIFGSRVAGLSDDELDQAKASDAAFFDLVYGCAWGRANLGNTEPGDGYRYRGRGLFQLTGRGNYIRYGKLTGHPEIVDNPDLANDPAIAAAIAVAYMKDRYKGGGWEGMKRAVGNSVAGVGETKDRLFQQYLASGEFAARAVDTPPGVSGSVDLGSTSQITTSDPVELQKGVQRALAAAGFNPGPIDGDPGPLTRQALHDYRAARHG